MQNEQPEQQGGKYNLLAKILSEDISRILTTQLSQIVSTFFLSRSWDKSN